MGLLNCAIESGVSLCGRQHADLVGEPCAGDPHARFDERGVETESSDHRATPRLYYLEYRIRRLFYGF